MKKPFFFGLFLALASGVAAPAQAGECAQTCVEVRRDGGELVITAKRDPAPVVRKTPTATPTPVPTFTRKPTAKKGVIRRARPKFSDQIRELLPTSSFTVLPSTGALIHEPLLIRSFGCENVVKKLSILDTTVELNLAPYAQWSWGDGQIARWGMGAVRGAHIYSRPGRVRIQMRCHWVGSYRTPHSPWLPIPEGIVSIAEKSVELFRAQLFFTE